MSDSMIFYFTFGVNHTHVIDGVRYNGKGYVAIEAQNGTYARAIMFAIFGTQWSMQYNKVPGDAEIFPRGEIKRITLSVGRAFLLKHIAQAHPLQEWFKSGANGTDIKTICEVLQDHCGVGAAYATAHWQKDMGMGSTQVTVPHSDKDFYTKELVTPGTDLRMHRSEDFWHVHLQVFRGEDELGLHWCYEVKEDALHLMQVMMLAMR